MKQRLTATAGTLALIGALALSGQAQAQNANDQAAAGAADQGATNTQTGSTAAPADQSTAQNGAAEAGALQEVVVTAERRAVSIQQTPSVVTAIEGDQLQVLHLNQGVDLTSTVAGLTASNTGGQYQKFNIRGLGLPQGASTGIQIGVKQIDDGIVQDLNSGLDSAMYDIADVEVLEGPQGTFVGASAIGGAVEINSANPNFNGFNGYALAGIGTYTDLHYQGALNLPLSDTLSLRFAFNFEQRGSFSQDLGDTLGGFYYHSYSATNPASDGPPIPLYQGSPGGTGIQIDPGNVDAHQYRLKALWKPTDNFQSLSEVAYSNNTTQGQAAEPNPVTYQNLFGYSTGGAGCNTVAGTAFTGTQLVCPGAGVTTHSQYYYPGEKPFVLDFYGTFQEYEDTTYQLSEELRYTLPDGIVVRSLTGFFYIVAQEQDNFSYGPQNAGIAYKPSGPDDIPSEEIDFISPTTGNLNWVAGAYWEYRTAPVPDDHVQVPAPYQPNAQPTQLVVQTPTGTPAATQAVFGQVNWHFTDTLELQVGARENYDWYNTSYLPNVSAAAGTLLAAPSGGGTYSILYTATACGTFTPPCYKVITPQTNSGKWSGSDPSGKIDLNWTPVPGQNFYAFYARGYSSGGANASSSDHPIFNPETVNDWEAGWKGRLLDGHVITQFGVYYERVQNYQYPLEDTEAALDTSLGSYIANLPPSSIDGLSAAAQARFGGLGVNVNWDYNRSTLGSIRTLNSSALPGGFGNPLALPQCLPGHTYNAPQECFDYTPYLTNVGGEPIPNQPENSGNIAVDYLFHVGVGTLDPRVTFAYASTQYGTEFENAYNEIPSTSILGASVDWVVGKWDTQLWGTNLTNLTYVSTNMASYVYYGSPRQLGVQATYRF